jgi:hypothetical protein
VARRKATGVEVAGVIGLFQRTEQEWHRLGAPLSLYDETEAARAWMTYTRPESSLRYLDPRMVFLPDAEQMPRPTAVEVLAHDGARCEAASRWWRVGRWRFLERFGVMTPDERVWVDRYAARWPLAELVDPVLLERHLFGHLPADR